MHINLTGHRMEITPSLRAFTEEKFNILERHSDKITAINVVFDVEKLIQMVAATITVAKGELYASSESEDMYTAIDELVHKLDRQLIKHKEKKLQNRNHPHEREFDGEDIAE